MTEPTHETTEQDQVPPTTEPAVTTPMAAVDQSGFDLGSFLSGLLFLALGFLFVLEAADVWTFRLTHFRYVGPLVLVIIGLAILVGTGLSGRQQHE